MSWDTPITNGKTTESKYALDTKVVYCIASYNDEYNEMTLTYFVEHFEEILNDIEFEWKHKKKDGSPRYPSYKQITNNWFYQYEWKRCAKEYVEEKTDHAKEESILIYNKKILKDTISDFKLIDSLRERIKFLQKQEKENVMIDKTYRIAKLEETINSIWHRILERLELDKNDDKHALIPVNIKPIHENQDLRDAWNELLWEHVEPRG